MWGRALPSNSRRKPFDNCLAEKHLLCRPVCVMGLRRTMGSIFLILFIVLWSMLLAPFQCNQHPNGKMTMKRYKTVFCNLEMQDGILMLGAENMNSTGDVSQCELVENFGIGFIAYIFWGQGVQTPCRHVEYVLEVYPPCLHENYVLYSLLVTHPLNIVQSNADFCYGLIVLKCVKHM